MTKHCSKCKKTKSEIDFQKNRTCPDGLNRWCKQCQNQARRLYLQLPATKKQRQQYHQLPEVKERQRESQRSPKAKAKRRQRIQHLRYSQIERYGGQCHIFLCGNCDIRNLVIDHIHGGGNKHRQELGDNIAFYRWLSKQPLMLDKFRVLCRYCNNCKRPHIPDYKVGLKTGRAILNSLDRQQNSDNALTRINTGLNAGQTFRLFAGLKF